MADFNLPDEGPMFLADETLHEAYELEIQSEKGNNVRFGELVAGKGDSVTTIVIFSELCIENPSYLSTFVAPTNQVHNYQSATSSASTTKTTSEPYPVK